MTKSSILGSDDQREINPQWFTGKAWMKMLSSKIGIDKQDMYHVHFESGARTKIHRHNGSQILIVTEGNGSLDVYEAGDDLTVGSPIAVQESTRLSSGDVVFIREGMLHSHGSTDPSTTFSHIAINNLPCGVGEYTTEWYDTADGAISGRI